MTFLGRNYCSAISLWERKNLNHLITTSHPQVSTANSSGSMTSQLLTEQEDCPVWGLKTVFLNNHSLSLEQPKSDFRNDLVRFELGYAG